MKRFNTRMVLHGYAPRFLTGRWVMVTLKKAKLYYGELRDGRRFYYHLKPLTPKALRKKYEDEAAANAAAAESAQASTEVETDKSKTE